MARRTRSFKSAYYISTGGPVGYGIYLTDKRRVGVSYNRIVSRSFYPAYALFLIWIISLIGLIAYARLTGSQELLPLPFVMGLAVVALVFLVYWSPKQALKRVEHSTIASIEGLRNATSDIALNRADISKVTARPGLTMITMKSGETHAFLSGLRGNKPKRFLSLLKAFCSLTPSIEMTLSDSSGKNMQEVVGPIRHA